ncbi:MAG: histidine phosphatase family protein [Synergistaceae bacterium]|jgi:alpha-ribazole phosphatase/probable phosphoglycerate mutase|nr:histidine phosphatase family protein [Synergistaceae bacterium]
MDSERDSHRVFLVRHGETAWNKEFRYQGISDVPLDDEGLEQARRVGLRLSLVPADRVLTSPLSRARRTTEIIMEHNPSSAEITTKKELVEISFGIWEGLTVSEIKEIDGDTFSKWRETPFFCVPEGGESLSDVFGRSKTFADELIEAGSPGEDTFVVAHGGVIRALAAVLLGFDRIDLLWRMRFDNCSVTVIDIWKKSASMLLSNDTNHLRLDDRAIPSLVFPR